MTLMNNEPQTSNSDSSISIDKNRLKARIDAALMAMLGSEELVRNWWLGDNLAFGLKPPLLAWEHDPLSVYAYVIGHLQR